MMWPGKLENLPTLFELITGCVDLKNPAALQRLHEITR